MSATMKSLETRFTKLMNIRSPIVSAPMYTASTPQMATIVTSEGGFGLIAAGLDPSAKLKQDLITIRTTLGIPLGKPIPVGVGLLGWILDRTEVSDDPRLPAVLDELPEAIWFAFGNDLGKYVKFVKKYDEKREYKTKVFVIVNSVEDAVRAAKEWGVDVLVVQGIEAGGHGSATALPLLTLLQGVLNTFPANDQTRPSIIAAGGIMTGAQIAALLTLGADGVAVGTRFLFTNECMYPDIFKDVLKQAGMNSTKRGLAFDEVNRTNFWPEGIDGQAISNGIMKDVEEGLDVEERLKRYDVGKEKGEKERLVIWAGAGVGLVDSIKPVAEVVRLLHDETVESLKRAARLAS